ncbi:hypothetical protein ISS07_05670 [Candidatus Woesearchaeota archaeon]|nr:hypothetical protein [Candidatus Woesearchaeota archaeon]
MDNKKLGILIIFIGIIFLIILFIFKIQLGQMTDSLMTLSGGSCFLESGKCIHEQNNLPFIFGFSIVILTISLGIYLIYFSRTMTSIETTQKNILSSINSARDNEIVKEKFNILLQGLDEDEKKIMLAVKEQDGISQTTLRYRIDMSKSKLSMVLSQLEKKNLLTKIKKGKINNVFLKKAP